MSKTEELQKGKKVGKWLAEAERCVFVNMIFINYRLKYI